MPQKVLKFTGINRRVSEFNGAGTCEELINIRPSVTGARIVRKKKVIKGISNSDASIVEHKFGAQENLVVLGGNYVAWRTTSGELKGNIIMEAASEAACAGNVLVLKMADGSQKVFKFEDGEYKEFSVSIPSIDISVQLNNFDASVTYTSTSSNQNIDSARATLSSAYSSFYNKYNHGLAGPIVVGCTFELEDGSEVWSSGFSIINPTKDVRFKGATNTSTTATVYGATEAVLTFDVENYSKVTGVKSIKIYSSTPQSPYDINDQSTGMYTRLLTSKEMNLAGQPMYLQKTFSFKKTDSFKLNTNYQITANDLMPVTEGATYRTGDVISYNNRFHYFNSSVNHVLQKFSYGVHKDRQLEEDGNTVDIRTAWLYAVIDSGEKKTLIEASNSINVQMFKKMDLVYPIGGIKQGYIKTVKGSDTIWYSVEFDDSTAYNYSCALDYDMSLYPCGKPDLPIEYQTHGNVVPYKNEYTAINVSAQYNPYVFPVNYSYGFDGKILDVVTSYLPISATQVGQYPITVFTTNGIYALEQGSGQVLYSGITPLQPFVSSGKATSTPHGIFFISSNNLYLLRGRESANVSYVLMGETEQKIRETESYKQLCCNNNGTLYDFSSMLSGKEFEQFVSDAVLTYDQLQNELIISNSTDSYSYVFNLDTQTFYKTTLRYKGTRNGARYTICLDKYYYSIVDMHTEESVDNPILLQSRPFQLEAFFTHIQRLIMLIDADLSSSNNICLSVFGSDDLNNWKCIISAQKTNTVLRQIRTNKAAKSYRDYVILINGTVSSRTDLSDIIADYSVVNRRLG